LPAVSETSVVRAPNHTQAGNRSQAGADQASTPFSELLDGCEAEAPAPASISKPLETTRTEASPGGTAPAEAAPQEGKTGETEIPVTAENKESALTPAELALVIAAAGQAVPQGKETKEGQPAVGVSPDDVISDETQSDTDGQADVPQADAADALDVQVVVQPAPAPVATPVPSTVPAVTDADVAVAVVAAPTATEAVPAAEPVAPDSKGTIPPVVEAATSETVAKSDTALGKDSDPTPPANKERAAHAALTEQASTAKTETASTGKAATPDLTTPTVEAQDGEKPAPRPTDTANGVRSDADTLNLKPGMPAAQTSPDATANSAALPPLAVPPTATSQVAQLPAQHQPLSAEAVPVAGLAVEIAANAHNGKSRFEIRLDPPELGRIDVQLNIDGEGQVTSHLRVERPETLDMLRRDAPSLERALQQAGLKTSDSGLQFSLRDQSFSQHNQGRDTPATARIVVPDENLVPVEAQRQYGRLAGTGGGVDIRI
jgi:flagellar hook-length control protein FliK